MYKTLILVVVLFFTNPNAFGQNSNLNDSNFSDNIRFGGSVNIEVGNSYSTFSIAPSVIYDFSDQFGAGIGLSYLYVKNKSITNSTTNLYGGSFLLFYKPIDYLQFSAEFEQLKFSQSYASNNSISAWQPALYIGGEYVTGNIAMGLRYDVLFDKTKNIIYSSALSPVFRVYF